MGAYRITDLFIVGVFSAPVSAASFQVDSMQDLTAGYISSACDQLSPTELLWTFDQDVGNGDLMRIEPVPPSIAPIPDFYLP